MVPIHPASEVTEYMGEKCSKNNIRSQTNTELYEETDLVTCIKKGNKMVEACI